MLGQGISTAPVRLVSVGPRAYRCRVRPSRPLPMGRHGGRRGARGDVVLAARSVTTVQGAGAGSPHVLGAGTRSSATT